MNIGGWIQISDYTSIELGTVSYDQAAHEVLSFDWAIQLHDFCERVLHKEDSCPPGVGFNTAEEKDVFHVYAVALNEWQLHLELSQPGKILGLFRKPPKNLDVELQSLQNAVELLRLFFNGEKEKLLAEAASRI